MGRWTGIIIAIVVVGLAAMRFAGGGIDAQIKREANEINKSCPKMIDDVTRLDHVTPGSKQVTFDYTIMGKLGDSLSAMDKMNIESQGKMMILGNQDFKKALKAGVTAHFNYHNETGAVVESFSVGPADAN